VITAVPGDTPDTVPVDPTVAIPGEPELHEPPSVGSVNPVVDPVHTEDAPAIAPGTAFTVTPVVTRAVQPNPFVTV
jgi:hypothetical protein